MSAESPARILRKRPCAHWLSIRQTHQAPDGCVLWGFIQMLGFGDGWNSRLSLARRECQGLFYSPAQAAFKVGQVGSVSPSSGESQEVRRGVAVTDGICKLVWKHPFKCTLRQD